MIRSAWAALAAAVFALVLSGCREKVSSSGLDFHFLRRELSNGIQVLIVENPDVPVIAFQTWVTVGSGEDRVGKTGRARVAQQLRNSPAINRLVESQGGEARSYTQRDYTVFAEAFPPTLLDRVIELESERWKEQSFTEEMLLEAKAAAIEERRIVLEHSEGARMNEALWALAFHHHPYRWPTAGVPMDVVQLTREDVQEFFNTYYAPQRLFLVIVGAVNAERTWTALKKAYAGTFQTSPRRRAGERDDSALSVPEPEQREERRLIVREGGADSKFAIGYHITSARHVDTHALDILAGILFEGKNSRAYQKLVVREQLVTELLGMSYTPKEPGLFVVTGTLRKGVTLEKVEQSLRAMWREVETRGVSREEIRRAVRQLKLQLVDQISTPQGMAQLLGTVHAVLGDAGQWVENFEKYSRIEPEQVRQVYSRYFDPNNRTVISLVPPLSEKGP